MLGYRCLTAFLVVVKLVSPLWTANRQYLIHFKVYFSFVPEIPTCAKGRTRVLWCYSLLQKQREQPNPPMEGWLTSPWHIHTTQHEAARERRSDVLTRIISPTCYVKKEDCRGLNKRLPNPQSTKSSIYGVIT